MTTMRTPPPGHTPWESLTPEQQRAEWARFHGSRWAHPVPPVRPAAPGVPRWAWVLLALAAVAVVVIVVGAVLSGRVVTVPGSMTVYGGTTASYSMDGSVCTTLGGYSDIAQGATVTVRDSADRIVAVGALDSGRTSGMSCVFPFSVPEVPRSDYYTVEIANRGPLTYSADDVEAGGVAQELSSY